MNDDLDAMLQTDLLRPPADFTQRVMQRLALQKLAVHDMAAHDLGTQMRPRPAPSPATMPQLLPQPSQLSPLTSAPSPVQPAQPDLWHRLRWLAARAGLVGAGLLGFILGLGQLASFVFGLWLTAAAL